MKKKKWKIKRIGDFAIDLIVLISMWPALLVMHLMPSDAEPEDIAVIVGIILTLGWLYVLNVIIPS